MNSFHAFWAALQPVHILIVISCIKQLEASTMTFRSQFISVHLSYLLAPSLPLLYFFQPHCPDY
jgi:hypothetical protein